MNKLNEENYVQHSRIGIWSYELLSKRNCSTNITLTEYYKHKGMYHYHNQHSDLPQIESPQRKKKQLLPALVLGPVLYPSGTPLGPPDH